MRRSNRLTTGSGSCVNLNLWTGLGMLGVGVTLALWAVTRPIRLVEDEEALELERTRQEGG